jgi:DNA-binding NtrC family response regulator
MRLDSKRLHKPLLARVFNSDLGIFLFSSKPTILIVDDDVAILNVFSKIFQRNGYVVTVAKKGKEALEKIKTSRYDVALIDLGLPDMEGDRLFPLISNASPKTVKIILTGKIDRQGSIEGADVFVGKPVAPDKLLSIIAQKLTAINWDENPKNALSKSDRLNKTPKKKAMLPDLCSYSRIPQPCV